VNISIDGVTVPGEGWFKRVVGTVVTKIVTIAGKGAGTPFRDASYYVARYGGDFGDWQKLRGEIVLDYYSIARSAEIHWVQGKSVGPVKEKFRRWLN